MIKIIILDQSKPISLISEKIESKFQKSTIWTYIIHKNGNNTCIQPILKSNSTSFTFNNIFCEMNGKKVTHWGGPGGNGETILISS